MKKGSVLLFSLLLEMGNGYAQFPTSRVATQWPFAQNSIWNMPIGSNAVYLPAGIGAPGAWSMTVDEDILILAPDAPLQDVLKHNAGWSDRLRCESILDPQEVLIANVPIPSSFSTDPDYNGLRPNHSAALLRPDGRTIVQTQPFHVCGAGGAAVSQFRPPDEDILSGDGIRGAHGGSGMSSIGGTLRLGELVPDGFRNIILWDFEGKIRQAWEMAAIHAEMMVLEIKPNLADGIYYLEIWSKEGQRTVEKILILRE